MFDGAEARQEPLPFTKRDKPETVRVASTADEANLFEFLCVHLYADNDMGFVPSREKVWNHVNWCCRGQRGIAGIIDGPNGEIAGSVGIIACQPWYSETWLLSQVWNFVRSDFRKGTRNGQALFDFALWHREDMCARIGYEIGLETSVYSFNKLEAKERLWGTHARKVGAMYWVNGGHHG